MKKEMVAVNCPSCDRNFRTSLLKCVGDKFQCYHCHHPMKAESDWGEDGAIVWYAVSDSSVSTKVIS